MAAPTNDESCPADLAARFRADDAAAAQVLAEHLLPVVTRLVRRLSAWSVDGEDLVQDVLVTALAKRRTFNGDARLETWITRITINRCRAHARKAWMRRKLFRGWAEQQRLMSHWSPSPETACERTERVSAVQRAVAELPQMLREAIVLCSLEGRTAAEAAALLGVRPGTVEVRLCRARKQLRAALAGKLGERPSTESEIL